nr:immunoglobulin heavy chain junction region [Macaca mulatta]
CARDAMRYAGSGRDYGLDSW